MYTFNNNGQELIILEDYSLKKGAPFSLKISTSDEKIISLKELMKNEKLLKIFRHVLNTESFIVMDETGSKHPHIRLFDADMCTSGDVRYFFGKNVKLSCCS